ncbi:MAG: FliA/WhiG family RNA polymerase sigma factor [Nitrospinae bacterium]|nr:FliA/WhiG family RNA polymerase sigma factor [Nitrospinota bacterium]
MISDEQKRQLVTEYATIIKLMAGRLAMRTPPSVELDDLVQTGVIGLLEALERYDPSRNVQFKTYAEIRVWGAMLDYLRSLDWVPTSQRKKIKRLKEVERRLEAQKGRALTREELAEATGETVENVDKLLWYTQNLVTLSLYEEGAERIASIADEHAIDPLDNLEKEDLRKHLATTIADLPQRERLVLSLYYFEGLSMKVISKALEVTVSRISQIHSAAIRSARRKLSALMEDRKGV